MNNQNKWNIELLYSAIFFVAIIVMLGLHPFLQLRELISPQLVSSQILLYLWAFTFLFALFCSFFTGIQSWKKARIADSECTMFYFLTRSIPGFSALFLIFLSLVLLTIFIIKTLTAYST